MYSVLPSVVLVLVCVITLQSADSVHLLCVQKNELQRIEEMSADYCLQIQELEHCISTRDAPSSHLDNT